METDQPAMRAMRNKRLAKPSTLKVGAVLTFPTHLTKRQIVEFLMEWRDEQLKDGSEFVFDSIQVGTYDPEIGGPVFYVP